jgi:uncharacterized membrane protein YfcA
MIAVIASSGGASMEYLKVGMTNVRLSMFLETGTVLGALLGALLVTRLDAQLLEILFAVILFVLAIRLYILIGKSALSVEDDAIAKKLRLGFRYNDGKVFLKREGYGVKNSLFGLFGAIFAGCFSSLFGMGSGTVMVPLLNQVMGVPIKAAAATSQFMMAVTAATGILVFLKLGYVSLELVAPVALGVTIGSVVGGKASKHFSPDLIKKIFILLIVYIGVRMALKGLGVLL